MTTTVVEIELPLVPARRGGKPAPPLNANQRLHWRRKAELTRLVRLFAKNAAVKARIGQCTHLTVTLHYAPGDNIRRDAPNLVATSKPAIDGLVDAGLVRDDTAEWVTEHMPLIHPGPGQRRLWLEVTVEGTR